MSKFLYAILMISGFLAGPAIVLSAAPPVSGELVLVVGADAPARVSMVAAAGGRIVGPQQAALGAFAVSDNPDFIMALKASGVWFVLDGRQIAWLCGVSL